LGFSAVAGADVFDGWAVKYSETGISNTISFDFMWVVFWMKMIEW